MRRLREVGLEFLDDAPTLIKLSAPLAASPTEVFAAVSGDPESWGRWFPGFREGSYLSPPPHGVGSRRRLRVRGAGTYVETILAWDEPYRWAFRVDECSAPLWRALAEEWRVEAAPAGSVLHWTFAAEPTPMFAPVLRLSRRRMARMFEKEIRALDAVLSASSGHR